MPVTVLGNSLGVFLSPLTLLKTPRNFWTCFPNKTFYTTTVMVRTLIISNGSILINYSGGQLFETSLGQIMNMNFEMSFKMFSGCCPNMNTVGPSLGTELKPWCIFFSNYKCAAFLTRNRTPIIVPAHASTPAHFFQKKCCFQFFINKNCENRTHISENFSASIHTENRHTRTSARTVSAHKQFAISELSPIFNTHGETFVYDFCVLWITG